MRLKIKNGNIWKVIPTDEVGVLSGNNWSVEIINTTSKEENINDK